MSIIFRAYTKYNTDGDDDDDEDGDVQIAEMKRRAGFWNLKCKNANRAQEYGTSAHTDNRQSNLS